MTLHEYVPQIKKLPLKTKYQRADLLTDDFKVYEQGKMKIFYAPHNEYINKKAKILIVGICPGWTQTEIALRTAKNGIEKSEDMDKILKDCKRLARFAGSMRTNLIQMLDEIKLNEKLKIKSCAELFEENNDLLHTTSLIPYPVFIADKNYTGYAPMILETDRLMEYVREHFYHEIEVLGNVFIIPLGKAVEDVLKYMIHEKMIKEEQCLFGFPHPSGANGHRKKQFEENRNNLPEKVDNFFRS